MIQKVILKKVDGPKKAINLLDIVRMSNSMNCFNKLTSWLVTNLHKDETKEFYCLGAQFALDQVDLHFSLLEVFKDLIEDAFCCPLVTGKH